MASRAQDTEKNKSNETTWRGEDWDLKGPMADTDVSAESGRVVGQIKDAATNLTNQASQTFQEVSQKAKEYGNEAVSQTRTFIRQHPGQSIAAGFGLGIVVGMLLARR